MDINRTGNFRKEKKVEENYLIICICNINILDFDT